MADYTRLNRKAPAFEDSVSPALIFNKWQVWDNLRVPNPERKDSKLEFLQNVGKSVNKTMSDSYRDWFNQYNASLKKMGAQSRDFTTIWRLLVGWGTNPTMETGLYLHHLAGFPYIPGSAVKGLLHHVAEMEIAERMAKALKDKTFADATTREEAEAIVKDLKILRELFGSLRLERMKTKGSNEEFGPETPLSYLRQWQARVKDEIAKSSEPSPNERLTKLQTEIDNLLKKDQTGGLLSFYDAVPDPKAEKFDMLQPDIVNVHYPDYYRDTDGKTPPSDDQSPNPVYFLAVRPRAKFTFFYRVKPISQRDEEGQKRAGILGDFDVDAHVQNLLTTALGLWGVGAKTAAGYGYFDTGAVEITTVPNPAPDGNGRRPEPPPPNGEDVEAIKPADPIGKDKSPQSKTSGIGKDHGLDFWLSILKSPYIKQAVRKQVRQLDATTHLPVHVFGKKLREMEVHYLEPGKSLYCVVNVTLKNIDQKEHAQWVWENEILPHLPK